jgi:hypothetical protein
MYIASHSPVQSSAFGPMVKPLPKIQNAISPLSRGQILGDFFSGVVCDTMNNLKPKNHLLQFVQGKSYIDRTTS